MSTHRQETSDGVLWWATNAEDQAELEAYATRGVLAPIGYGTSTPGGQRCLVYRENRSLTGAILEDLEADGLVVRTGETRPARDGRMEPVYVAIQHAPRRPRDVLNLLASCQRSPNRLRPGFGGPP